MSRPQSIIPIGSAQISSAQSKFGRHSALFDGNGDSLLVGPNPNFATGTDPFTVEGWFRWQTAGRQNSLIDMRVSGTESGILFVTDSNLLSWFDGSTITGGTTLSANTWYHIALVRSGTNLKVYINGTEDTTFTRTNYTKNITTQGPIHVGDTKDYASGFPNQGITGWIDELRLSNVARYSSNFTPSTVPFENDSNTLLLIHADATNGSTFFEDDNGVRTQRGISAVNGARIDTSQSRFGGSSGQFTVHSGTSDRCHVGEFNAIGTAFTFEAWVRVGNYNFNQIILSQDNGSSNDQGFQFGLLTDRRLYFTYWTSSARSSAVQINSTGTAALTTWQHIAVSWTGTTLNFYINGANVGSSSVSSMYQSSADLAIGGLYTGNSAPFNGHLDEVRISNIARYTSNFAAPTQPFVNDTNTQLLVHMDGTSTSTIFRDDNGAAIANSSGRTAKTIEKFNDVKISTVEKAVGSSSAYFDGVDDSLKISTSQAFTGNFTVEFWYYPSDTNSGFRTMFANGEWNSSGAMNIGHNGTQIFVSTFGNVGFIVVNSAITAATWQHFALVRNGSTVTLYKNGTSIGSATNSSSLGKNSNFYSVGSLISGSSIFDDVIGYIDEVRVSDVARYSANFTTATTPFVDDINTVFLLHFEGANNSTVFVDDTGGGRSQKGIVAIGNAQISTAQSKFGGSSYLGDGTGDYLRIDDTANLAYGTSDFTIEFWIRFSSTATQIIWDQRPAGLSTVHPTIYWTSSTIRYFANTADRITSSTLSTNTWYHVAVSRSGNSTKMFINGSQAGSTYTDSTVYQTGTPVVIGADSDSLGNSSVNGHIDELRVSNIARYIANFTPSTEQFVNDPNTLLLIHADGANASTAFFDDNSGLTGETLEAEADLSSSASLSADAIRFRSTRIDMGYYFDPGYIDADYYYENPSVFSLSAELTEVVGEIVEANGAFTSSFAQTAIVGKIQSAVVDVGALFSPSFTVNAIRNSFAVLDTLFTIDTTAVANRSITQTLENIANLDAQAARFVGVSSDISAQASVTAEVDAFKTTSVSLDSNLTVDTTALRFRTSQADLNSESTLTALADKVQNSQADLSSEFTQTSTVGIVKEFSIDAGSLFTPQVDINVTLNALATIEATVTVSVQAQVTRNLSSDLEANSAVVATAEVTRLLDSTVSSEFVQSADAERFRTSQVTLSSAFDQSATATRIQPAASDLSSEFAQSALVARTRDDSATISSEFAQVVDYIRYRDAVSTQASEFAQSATVFRIQSGVADLTSTSMLVVDAVKTTDISATGQAQIQIESTAVKTVDSISDLGALFTPALDADAQFAGIALLESRATLTAVIGKVQSAQSKPQYGAIFTSPDHLLKSMPTTVNLFGSVDVAGVDNNIKSTISFWSKVERGQKFDVLMSYHPFNPEPPSFGGYTRIIIDSQIISGVRTRQFRFAHANGSLGSNASLEWSWNLTETNDWTHYLFVIDDTRFSGFGSPRIARLYVNGAYQGQRTVTGANAYSINARLETPSFALGYNAYQEQQPGAWGTSPYTTERNNTLNSQLAQLWVGRLTHTYDVNNASSVLGQFYNGDYINLPSTGLTANGTTPQVYEDFSTYSTLTPVNGAPEDFVSTEAVGGYNVARFSLTVSLLGVVLNIAELSATSSQQTQAIRIRTNGADITAETDLVIEANIQTETVSNLISETTQITDIERFRQVQSTLTSEFDLTGSVRFETKFESDLFSEFTIISVIGLEQEFASDLASEFVFAATTTIIDPIRAEADLNADSTVAATVTRIKPLASSISADSELAADVTVIPPIRAEADLLSESTLAVDALKIVEATSNVNSVFAVSVTTSVTVGIITAVQAQSTLEAEAFKVTGIAPTTLQVTGFVLTAGDVINFDPFLTLKIKQETRGLEITAENRVISIEQETRLNIIQGY